MGRFWVGNLVLRKVLHNKGALDPGWEGPFKIAEVLTPGAYELAHLNGEQISRSWNADHLKDVLSIAVWTLINKSSKFKNLKLKNPPLMNFELEGHIVWNAELKKEERILKKFRTSLCKEAIYKINILAYSGRTLVQGLCTQRTTMPRIVAKTKS